MSIEIRNLLLEEIEFKRPYRAAYEMACQFCGGDIHVNDVFYFFGDKKKVCIDCVDEFKAFILSA